VEVEHCRGKTLSHETNHVRVNRIELVAGALLFIIIVVEDVMGDLVVRMDSLLVEEAASLW